MKLKPYVSTPCSDQYRLIDLQQRIADDFSKLVGVDYISSEIFDNVSDKNVNELEMFIALSSCPSFYSRLYWHTIYGPKSRIPVLAADIIKKAEGDEKIKAIRIFAKIASVLGFEHITYQEENNTALKFENITNVKGEQMHINHLSFVLFVL